MSEKAKDEAVSKEEQKPELSDETLEEVAGGGIIVEDLKGAPRRPAREFHDALITETIFPALDGSSKDPG